MASQMLATINDLQMEILQRPFDAGKLQQSEIDLIRPVADANISTPVPIDEKTLKQCIRALATMPRQHQDEIGGRMKFNIYTRKGKTYSAEAWAYALDRIFDELKWMPEWSEIKPYLEAYRSPEENMIRRARILINRGAKKEPKPMGKIDQEAIDALPAPLKNIGLKNGYLIEKNGKIVEAD